MSSTLLFKNVFIATESKRQDRSNKPVTSYDQHCEMTFDSCRMSLNRKVKICFGFLLSYFPAGCQNNVRHALLLKILCTGCSSSNENVLLGCAAPLRSVLLLSSFSKGIKTHLLEKRYSDDVWMTKEELNEMRTSGTILMYRVRFVWLGC